MEDKQKKFFYFEFRIETNKLKTLPPLGFVKDIDPQSLKYLYMDLLLTKKEIGLFYACSDTTISKLCKKYGLIKTKQQQKASSRRRSLDKYGVEHPAQLESAKTKYKNTCLQKYGTTNIFSSEIGKQKVRQGNLNKYGVPHNHQAKVVVDKMKNTCLTRYGFTCSLNNKEVKKKAQETWIKNWGVDHPWKNTIIQQQKAQTLEQKYGNSIVAKTQYFKNLQEKYQENWNQKAYETLRKNRKHKDSKQELNLLNLLKQKYPETIHHPDKTDKYPFVCDFYIPELDLYIEYNGYICHGYMPWDVKNNTCLLQFNKWLKRSQEINKRTHKKKSAYLQYLYIWCIYDVLKRTTANKNKLNYIELFSYKDALNFITQI